MLATVLISVGLGALLFCIALSLWRNRKNGTGGCPSCKGCGMADTCRKKK